MLMFSFFQKSDLCNSMMLVSQHRSLLARLLTEVNHKLGDGEPGYAVYARQVWGPEVKWWPWGPQEFKYLRVELLYGKITEGTNEMQILNVGEGEYETYLKGILDGVATRDMAKNTPVQYWEDFLDELNFVDGSEAVNFLGSIKRYEKVFLKANERK